MTRGLVRKNEREQVDVKEEVGVNVRQLRENNNEGESDTLPHYEKLSWKIKSDPVKPFAGFPEYQSRSAIAEICGHCLPETVANVGSTIRLKVRVSATAVAVVQASKGPLETPLLSRSGVQIYGCSLYYQLA